MEDLKNKAIKSVFWVGSIKFLSQAISWAVTILLIRILTPEDYGLMGIALAYKMLLAIFFDLAIGEAILQKKELHEEDRSTAFWLIVVFSLALLVATWFAAPHWAAFFDNAALIDIIRVVSISLLFFAMMEVSQRLLARRFEFKRRSQFELIAAVLSLLVSLTMALQGYGVWALVIGDLVRNAVLAVLVFWYAKWVPHFIFSLHSVRHLLGFGFPITGHYISEFISTKSDSLIIGRMLGQDTLGYYTVAMSVSRIPVAKGIQIIQQVLFPVFSALQNDTREFQRYFYQVVYLVSIIFFPVFLGMLAVSEEIVVVILSEKWLPSLFVFQVFTAFGLLFSFAGILVVILKSRAATRSLVHFSLYSAVLMPVAFLAGSMYGLKGVAIGWAAVYPILFGYLFNAVMREIDVRLGETLANVSQAFIGSMLMLAVVLLGKQLLFPGQANLTTMVFGVVVGMIVYPTYLWIFSRKTFSDMKSIWERLRSKS